MGDKTWKKMERGCAKDIGSQRVVCSGVRGEGDIESPDFYIECKYRKKFVCKKWFEDAKKKGKKMNKKPILIIKEKGQHGELAVVDWEWLAEIIKERRNDGI